MQTYRFTTDPYSVNPEPPWSKESNESGHWEMYLKSEADELIQRLRSALADIAFSADMTLEVARNKAKRIYDETAGL